MDNFLGCRYYFWGAWIVFRWRLIVWWLQFKYGFSNVNIKSAWFGRKVIEEVKERVP